MDPHDSKVVFANEKECELSGYSEEELVKLNFANLFAGDKKQTEEEIKSLIAQAFYEGPQYIEREFVRKSGEVFSAAVYLKKCAITNSECVIVTIRDVTPWKNKETDLQAAQSRYQELLYHSDSLIYHLDAAGTVINVNEAVKKIFDLSIEEVVGNHFTAFLHREDQQKGTDAFQEVIGGGLINDMECRCLARGNREIILKINIWPEFDDNEKIIGIYGVAIDITAQQSAVNKMREMVIQVISMLLARQQQIA